MSRFISKDFLSHLTNGKLAMIGHRVRRDDTLMLAFRKNYINVYYRGGSIIRISETPRTGCYKAEFDRKYEKPGPFSVPDLPATIDQENDCKAWIDALPMLKQVMDAYFFRYRKTEREFQQTVAWENNRSGIAKETEYFITDIEYATNIDVAGKNKRVRLDMLGLKWPRERGDDGSKCTPVFIEMKYGINAIGGKAGIGNHISDLCGLLESDSAKYNLNQMIEYQFKRLADFELIDLAKGKSVENVKLVGTPEVIILLASCIPRGDALRKALEAIKNPSSFKLRFFVANFAGYGMHDVCMMNLDEFRSRLDPAADQLAVVHQQ